MAGKARLAPIKTTTIPRLELTAAVTAVRMACIIQRDMNQTLDIRLYTDSSTVLQYITNEKRHFPIFVANRVQLIRDISEISQWYHIALELNPADEASRGLTVKELKGTSQWIKGPKFVSDDEHSWPVSRRFSSAPHEAYESDNEVESSCLTVIDEAQSTVDRLISYFSDWYRLRRAVAAFLKVKKILKDRISTKRTEFKEKAHNIGYRLSSKDIEEAEHAILKNMYLNVFPEEMKYLVSSDGSSKRSREKYVRRSSSLFKLSPYLDDGLLRVGGRLSRAAIPEQTKHPYILPRKHHITTLIIQYVHQRLGHSGRNHVLAELRNKFWIIGGNSAVRQVLHKCVRCRRLRGPVGEQKMADLPAFRVDNVSPPFYNTGVDYFGPFMVKSGRKEVKRYGVLFTCMCSRAVHLEVADSLETDTFINVLRRFIARRGTIKSLRSDNGSNLSGAEKELRQALSEMQHDVIQKRLLYQDIDWSFNPPAASHMGGIWERMIRSVRKVLTGLLSEHGTRLDVDSFHTLLCEVEVIINSRPITTVSGDPSDPEPLTPNHILTGKSLVTVPPPGVFQREDVYMRRRWRRVQYLANLFWSRWRNEYMLLQQPRQKWTKQCRSLQKGDIVLIKDDTAPRCDWQLGLVEETEKDKSGDVRAVTVKTQSSKLRRPINKLVLLVPVMND